MAHLLEAEAAPVVVVADAMVLRRAGLVGLLSGWAAAQGVRLLDLAPDAAGQDGVAPQLAILGLGALSIRDSTASAWLSRMRATWPDVALAIISDLDSAEEVVAALRAGARGFVPSTTAPDVALHAFSFLMRGGSYFPPGAVLARGPGGAGRSGTGGGPTGRDGPTHRPFGGLGARQQAILSLLQDGRSNKEIGRLLNLPESTVKVQVRRIRRRLGAANRTAAAIAAVRLARADVLVLPERPLKNVA